MEFTKDVELPIWKYKPYSFSRIESWSKCPKKFEYQYIIKPDVEKSSAIFEKGKLFHAILEYDMIGKIDQFQMEDEIKALSSQDVENIITQALTSLEESQILKDIKLIQGVRITEQEMFLGTNLQPVLSENDALIRGFIDLLIYDEKNKKCFIFDWKTGGKSKENLIQWPKPKDQLELYAIWVAQVFDINYLEASFVYVEHEHVTKYIINIDDIPKFKTKFLTKINKIENDNKLKKHLTTLCLWCDFKELCLGIPQKSDPRSMTKYDVFKFAEKKDTTVTKINPKNDFFLNSLKKKNTINL